ncbi:phage tail assembly chaperone G [Kluyvera genomosp. 1]|uniref:phage tail assembly chaperone G n=1 Tax=Kluyvera genomosp. 1 TaxID=2774053 RepID=UPI00068D8297|nr:phage minor tail protein G [Kluyvera genomosp. 1]
MSFLKKESLPLEGGSVVLYELSALQRADYFDYLASLEGDTPEDISEMKRMALMVKRNVQVNAWVVSRSLWQSAPDRDEDELHLEVMRTWSSEALNIAVVKVLELSGMAPKPGTEGDDNTGAEDEPSIKGEQAPLAK